MPPLFFLPRFKIEDCYCHGIMNGEAVDLLENKFSSVSVKLS